MVIPYIQTKMRAHRYIWVILSFIVISFLTSCDSDTTEPSTQVKQGVSGTVRNVKTGAPISNAIVTLVYDDTTSYAAYTRNDGTYGFDGLVPGVYSLSCEKDGYKSDVIRLDVVVEAGKNTVKDITLLELVNVFAHFHVRDAITKAPLVNASVFRDSSQLIKTDANGNAVYTEGPLGDLYFYFAAPEHIKVVKYYDLQVYTTVYDTIELYRPKDFLVASYSFSNNFDDSSGNGLVATNHGAAWTADRFGNQNSAISCDGVSDYVSVANAAKLNFGKETDFTLCAWINEPQSQTVSRALVVNKSTFESGILTGYSIEKSGVSLEGIIGTTYGEVTSSKIEPDFNRWHFITVVVRRTGIRYEKGEIELYIDGVLKNYETDDNEYLLGNVNTTAPLVIGGNGTANNSFKGKIDDVKIYGVALDKNAIQAVYHENGW
jgi:hypothetical protein